MPPPSSAALMMMSSLLARVSSAVRSALDRLDFFWSLVVLAHLDEVCIHHLIEGVYVGTFFVYWVEY